VAYDTKTRIRPLWQGQSSRGHPAIGRLRRAGRIVARRVGRGDGSTTDNPAGEAEGWRTPEEIAAARDRFEAAIPGWRPPARYGVGRRVDADVEFARINTEHHRLPAAILATVCGHRGGSASYPLTLADLDRAIALLGPAEADTSQPHPNLWAWRGLRARLTDTDEAIAVFDADPAQPCDDPYVLAMRAQVGA
jgi:hypothetical protein